jgi:transcriptional regulator with XRE-family HTH domain
MMRGTGRAGPESDYPLGSLVPLIKTTVGNNLLRLREDKRASQSALANASWLPPLTIRRVENAKTEPRLHTTILLSLALDVPLQSLLAGLPQGGPERTATDSGLYLPPGLYPNCLDHI